jgi:O-antigen/teichoic acid export membrane protein
MESKVAPGRGGLSVARDVAAYMSGQFALMAISLVSFPITTRLLPRAEYGILALTNVTVSLAALIVGLGLPNAIVRFLPEHQGSEKEKQAYNTTILIGGGLCAALCAALMLLLSAIPHVSPAFADVVVAFRYASGLLVTRTVANLAWEWFRVERRRNVYNALAVTQSVLSVAGSILGYLLTHRVGGMFVGATIGECLSATAALVVGYRSEYWKIVAPMWAEFRRSVLFSAPLMLAGICANLMAYCDRFLIQGYLGPEFVASYAVTYDICAIFQVLFITSFRLGVLPEVVNRYTNSGSEKASQFLVGAFRHLSWLLFGVAFGVVAVGPEVITLAAGARYRDTAYLLRYIMPAVMLNGLTFVFSSGFYLKKRNEVGLIVAGLSVLLNIGLNVLLIPKWKLEGSAVALLITFLFQAVGVYVLSQRFIPLRLDMWALCRAFLCGAGMFYLVTHISFGPTDTARLLVKVLSGVIVYATLLIAVERDAKRMFFNLIGGRHVAA